MPPITECRYLLLMIFPAIPETRNNTDMPRPTLLTGPFKKRMLAIKITNPIIEINCGLLVFM